MGDVTVSIIFRRPLRSVQLGFETSVYMKDECLEQRSENCNVSLRASPSCCGSAHTCCLQLALAVVRFGIFGPIRNSSDSHRTATCRRLAQRLRQQPKEFFADGIRRLVHQCGFCLNSSYMGHKCKINAVHA
jgi:hypothetical protein